MITTIDDGSADFGPVAKKRTPNLVIRLGNGFEFEMPARIRCRECDRERKPDPVAASDGGAYQLCGCGEMLYRWSVAR